MYAQPFELNLREVVVSLSDALDLVGVDDVHHGKRVAVMAGECARELGWAQPEIDELLAAAVLHDLGVSSTRVHRRLVSELEWAGAQEHCRVGHRLLEACPPLRHLAGAVLHHHSHWSALVASGVPSAVRLSANLIFLADRVDALLTQRTEATALAAAARVRAVIDARRGTLFAPAVVDAFLRASDADAFWLGLEPRFVQRCLRAWVGRGDLQLLSFGDVRRIAGMFAHCVDAKSPFTADHSRGVSRLARALAAWAGLPEADRQRLELAGLLHDLGKLRVPDEVLDKPAPLDDEELAVMERHSFDTGLILGGIRGLEEVAAWASEHHEAPDGRGYPYRHADGALGIQSRILAVADVFQALAQDRPYRRSVAPRGILRVLDERVHSAKLDAGVVALVRDNLAECWTLAHGSGPETRFAEGPVA